MEKEKPAGISIDKKLEVILFLSMIFAAVLLGFNSFYIVGDTFFNFNIISLNILGAFIITTFINHWFFHKSLGKANSFKLFFTLFIALYFSIFLVDSTHIYPPQSYTFKIINKTIEDGYKSKHYRVVVTSWDKNKAYDRYLEVASLSTWDHLEKGKQYVIKTRKGLLGIERIIEINN